MEITYKFVCNDCRFNTNFESLWKKHIMTELHKTGKKKIRSDKKFSEKCTQCNYIGKNYTNMTQHVLNDHSTKDERKVGFKYYCNYCDIGTFSKTTYKTHIETKKHQIVLNVLNGINKYKI